MSTDDVERFVSDLKSDPDLLAEAKTNAGGLGSIVDFAKGKGYDITIDEAKEYIRAEANRQLSDDQLDAVAGGKHHHSVKTHVAVYTSGVEAVHESTTVAKDVEVATGTAVGIWGVAVVVLT